MGKLKNKFTLGAQVGGELAAQYTDGPKLLLRNLLSKNLNKCYTDAVREFAPIARIDGDGWHWDREGCEKLRWQKKEGYITIDIMVPQWKWQNKSEKEIREYLYSSYREALLIMIERIEQSKAKIYKQALLHDFDQIRSEYLDNIENSYECKKNLH